MSEIFTLDHEGYEYGGKKKVVHATSESQKDVKERVMKQLWGKCDTDEKTRKTCETQDLINAQNDKKRNSDLNFIFRIVTFGIGLCLLVIAFFAYFKGEITADVFFRLALGSLGCSTTSFLLSKKWDFKFPSRSKKE